MAWMTARLRNYARFRGRARPREYWRFILFVVASFLFLSFVEGATGISDSRLRAENFETKAYLHSAWLGGVFCLTVLVPLIAVTVRRLHDTNRSGWWMLIWLVPWIGQIVMIVFMIIGGTRGPNRFGPDPITTDD